MSWGLSVYLADGTTRLISPEDLGALYVGSFSVAAGESRTFTFNGSDGLPNLSGRSIRVLQQVAGSHSWQISSQNPPTLTVTAGVFNPGKGVFSKLMVFAV
ncbi:MULTISPECIES: hypothetical protein [Azospirillaceae]|uniref:hypothetical protein n=1 Tax=Azospirillaceae TaxID=2829815 RepID=UPI000B7037E5|nr:MULTISPECIES: hypothetical protein [Azospirillaceae]MDG5496981.1 hypothetical protein [Niveispirillum sp. BGYR6]SNS84008.1 hypothetical protein SAMN05880556_11336 [Azospirillum sp. RU38E]SNT01279.1 hypothetical protein SAMN05880591_11335 [Azospirillum sp. RU37A]